MSFHHSLWGRLGTTAEVAGVFFIGGLIGSQLMALAGITSHPLASLMTDSPDMLSIAQGLATVLALQYVGLLGLAAVFLLIRKEHPRKMLGLSFANHRFITLLGIGLAGWFLGDLPNKLLSILDAEFDLGTSVPWREALLSAEQTPGWWLVMAIGSFGLIPIVEEVFWRGYVQSRLATSFSPAAALIAASAMFTLSHAQYHQADLFHVSTIFGVFISSLVLGWLFQKTGSLVPSIVMHAALNFPFTGAAAYVVLALMLVGFMIAWPPIRKALAEFADLIRDTRWAVTDLLTTAFLSSLMLGLSMAPQMVTLVGLGCLPVGIILAILARRRMA